VTQPRSDLGRTTLSVLFIGGLIAASAWVLAPFLAAFVWATMIVVATWPLLLRMQAAFGGRRGPAVAVMTLALLSILIVPLVVAVDALLRQAHQLLGLVEQLPTMRLPSAPAWLERIPLAGVRLTGAWNQFAAQDTAELMAKTQPYLREAGAWLMRRAGGFAGLLLQFVLVVVLAAILYSGGEAWGRWARAFGRRLADLQGERMVVLAGQAIRGVAMGVVITAVVQSALGGLGLLIVGVPFAGPLTAVMFAFCIAQLGPILVLLGATAWAYHALGPGWGTFLLVWSLVVGLLDNFLRPVLIRRGADLPLLLIVAGVIGGLIAFGIIGIFVGPVVLAVAYTLLDNWVTGPASGDGAAIKDG